MKERCNNPKNSRYESYGGRGISYPEKWESFEGFFEDMGERPEGMTLDRIDNNAGYSKENCKWSTIAEQNLNVRVRKDNKTGVKGVTFKNGVFTVTYKKKFIGRFKTLEEAKEQRRKYESGELTLPYIK